MKVLLVNGSPHKNGCTNEALKAVSETLQEEGIDTEIFWIGNRPIQQCIGCYSCMKKKECVFGPDVVSEFLEKAQTADGFIFGAPVYYAGPAGAMINFMNRAFFSATNQNPHPFRFKPAAAVASARRTGTLTTLDALNKYFFHGQMPIVTSRYWNEVYGKTADEVRQDEEGMQIMRVLGRNMAWMLKLMENGKKAGICPPKQEETRISTNFIR